MCILHFYKTNFLSDFLLQSKISRTAPRTIYYFRNSESRNALRKTNSDYLRTKRSELSYSVI